MFKTYLVIYTLTQARKVVIAESKEEAISLFMADGKGWTFFYEHYFRCIELDKKGVVGL
ncbi:MAG: hypothetical protein ACFFG0_08245 [Candidatus Thorarchaeota archaeon]